MQAQVLKSYILPLDYRHLQSTQGDPGNVQLPLYHWRHCEHEVRLGHHILFLSKIIYIIHVSSQIFR